MTTTQFGVLTILRHFEGLDQMDVSKKGGLDRTTTAPVVRKLQEKGWPCGWRTRTTAGAR